MARDTRNSAPRRLSDLHGDARRRALVERHLAGEYRWANPPQPGFFARFFG